MKTLHHTIGGALSIEKFEDGANRALHFLVGIESNLVAVEYQTDWQREMQLTFLRFVEFSSVEARANDVQLCLSKRAFHAEYKAVVEVGRIVAAIVVE